MEQVDYRKLWADRFIRMEEEKRTLLRETRRSALSAAQILVNQFHAKKVYLFGSVQKPDFFHDRSDIDLAVDGLPSKVYFSALAKMMDIFGGRRVDLIPLEDVPPSLEKQIREKGELLYG